MRGPAALLTLLAVAAATGIAAAADRFVPTDPDFVVANVRQAEPDERLRELLRAWRANPSTSESAALASAYIERARSAREPAFFGRAEAVLAPLASRPGASGTLRRLYAEVLQYRHDFTGAEGLLDALLRETPHDADARRLRATIRLVRGEFSGARADCAQLAAGTGSAAILGFACLGEALAGEGNLERALALLNSAFAQPAGADSLAQAYLLATRAELRERGGDLNGAILDYSRAVELAPRDDSIRAALADALAARGDAGDARDLLAIDRPSLALLVRSAALSEGAKRASLSARAAAWLALEAARGDAIHYREEALLALANAQPARALAAASRNFEQQKELCDVRVLARAAQAARDKATLQSLQRWMRGSGFRDSVTEAILDDRASS
jgi:Flp pilus assembly protein TadD